MNAIRSYGEPASHHAVDCAMPLHAVYVRRTSRAPTLGVAHERGRPIDHSVTPYQVVQRLGITTYLPYQLANAGAAVEVAAGVAMDVHYSVVSYLWALRFYGIDPVIVEWPKEPGTARLVTRKIDGDKVWNGTAYRPTYALVALMTIGLSGAEFDQLAAEYRRIPEHRRVETLRRTAAFYLQDPVDSFSHVNGFHDLSERYGLHPIV